MFYGWWIVAALFVALMTTAGFGFYNASVILGAANEQMGISVTVVSGATAMFFGVSGLTGYLLAPRMDSLDIRLFFLGGGVLGALTLFGLRWVDDALGLYVFFSLFGISFATAGLVPATTLVARWFETRRSVALSVTSTGLSFGGIAITPFIARALDDHSLGDVGAWMAAGWLVGTVPLTWLVVRSWPRDMGLHPDGAARATTGRDGLAPGATFGQARSTRFFRLLCVVYALIYLAQVGGIAHLYNLVDERTSAASAATALSVLAFSSVVGRLIGGVVVTRVSSEYMTLLLVALQAAALAAIAVTDGRTGLLVTAGVFGLSVGNLLMLQPLLLADAFGVREYSRIYSFNQLFGTIGVAGGPFLIGALRDLSGYSTAFIVAAGANVVGFGLLVMAGSIDGARSAWTIDSGGGDGEAVSLAV